MASYWLKYGNNVLHRNGYAVGKNNSPVDPYNPLGLPPFTVRVRLDRARPTSDFEMHGADVTIVDNNQHIYDITYASLDWSEFFKSYHFLVEVMGANLSGVFDMSEMFAGVGASLESVCLFDTRAAVNMDSMFASCTMMESYPDFPTPHAANMSFMFAENHSLRTAPALNCHNVTDMSRMFQQCWELRTVPLLDVSSVVNMEAMFINTYKVESGALALYQAASATQQVSNHSNTFSNCGRDAAQGAAIHSEMDQIPTSWGGNYAGDPENPYNLEPYTMRFKFDDDSYDPTNSGETWNSDAVWTRVSSSPNIWDYYQGPAGESYDKVYWQAAFEGHFNSGDAVRVLGGNLAGAKNMSLAAMFRGCTRLAEFRTVKMGTTTKTFSGMFNDCSGLVRVELFDVSHAENGSLTNLFSGCSMLETIPSFNTQGIRNFDSMLMGASRLITLPALDMSSAISASHMLDGTSALTNLPASLSTGNLQNAYGMFTNSGISSLPAMDTSRVTNFGMFCASCSHLLSIPLLATDSASNVSGMFMGCNFVTSGALDLYNQMSTQTWPPSSYTNAFAGCGAYSQTGAQELAQIPQSWGGTMPE